MGSIQTTISEESYRQNWSAVKDNLKAKNSNNKLLQTWFEPTEIISMTSDENGMYKIQLGVPTKLHKYWIIENLFDRICSEISAIYHSPFKIDFEVTGNSQEIEIQEVKEENENQFQKPKFSSCCERIE